MKTIFNLFIILCISISCDSDKKKDTTPPGAATLSIVENVANLELNWVLPTDKDIKQIQILRGINSSSLAEIALMDVTDELVYQDGTASEDTEYFYQIVLIDKSQNVGDPSNVVNGTKININPTVTLLAFNNTVVLRKVNANQALVDKYILEQSTDNVTFTVINDNLAKGTNKLDIDQLTNGTTYYFKLKAQDLNGFVTAGNVFSATPYDRLGSGWDLINQDDYDGAISLMSDNINNNIDRNSAYSVRGWSYLLKSDGEANTDAALSVSDFERDITNLDNIAGIIIASNIRQDYSKVIQYFDDIHQESSYDHAHLDFVSQRLIRIYGAYANYNLINFSEVVAILDIVEPEVDHSYTNSIELLGHINRLFAEESVNSIESKLLSKIIGR